MLESIWQTLANYGLDTTEISAAIASLFKVVTDEQGNVSYEGTLAPLADIPVIGDILKALAGFNPGEITTAIQ